MKRSGNKIIGVFGGPSSGKSTLAVAIADRLRQYGEVVHFVEETATKVLRDLGDDAVSKWASDFSIQREILATQLAAEVDALQAASKLGAGFVVSECPAAMTYAYALFHPAKPADFKIDVDKLSALVNVYDPFLLTDYSLIGETYHQKAWGPEWQDAVMMHRRLLGMIHFFASGGILPVVHWLRDDNSPASLAEAFIRILKES